MQLSKSSKMSFGVVRCPIRFCHLQARGCVKCKTPVEAACVSYFECKAVHVISAFVAWNCADVRLLLKFDISLQ